MIKDLKMCGAYSELPWEDSFFALFTIFSKLGSFSLPSNSTGGKKKNLTEANREGRLDAHTILTNSFFDLVARISFCC